VLEKSDAVLISDRNDENLWEPWIQKVKGLKIFTNNWLFTGILNQELDYDTENEQFRLD
jgi:hypothetical protein